MPSIFCQYKRELSIQVPGVGFLMTDLIWFSGKLEKTQVTAFLSPLFNTSVIIS